MLDYFRRDTGREDPRLMMDRYATVITQVSGLRLDPLPQVESASRGDILATYFKQSPFLWDADQEGEVAGQIALFRTLGLIPADFALAARDQASPLNGIAGIYDPSGKHVLLVKGASGDELARTLTHELVHAAQDQAIGLTAYQERYSGTLDATLAATALLEGQAQAVQVLQMLRSQMPDDAETYLAEILSQPMELVPTPGEQFLSELSLAPYGAGALFVLQRYQDGQEKDFAAMFDQVPTTTEQILHRDKFVAGEEPEQSPLAGKAEGIAKALGGTVLYQTRLGELVIASLMAKSDDESASRAAAGWNGDWAVVIQMRDGANVALLDTLWDSTEDAADVVAVLNAPAPAETLPDAPSSPRILHDAKRVLLISGPDDAVAETEAVVRTLDLAPSP
ncbi:hypothetical protein [Thiorhodococcus drewsii]|uniref:hypothetical protein n=1 Tax=Thiorhodococcus drewsii TaxID=210408 RepID=UPI0002F16101|nr:hypothetical protein [Thiorhodococcus drewsii]